MKRQNQKGDAKISDNYNHNENKPSKDVLEESIKKVNVLYVDTKQNRKIPSL